MMTGTQGARESARRGAIRESNGRTEIRAVNRELGQTGRNGTGVGKRIDGDVVVIVRGGVRGITAKLKAAIVPGTEIAVAAHFHVAVDANFPRCLPARADLGSDGIDLSR